MNYRFFFNFLLKIPLIFSVDSFDVRGMDVGSMVHVGLRLDNAGSFDWPWCADWVRIIIVYYLCGNSGEKFPLFFYLENRNGIEFYHLDNTDDILLSLVGKKSNIFTGIKFPLEWTISGHFRTGFPKKGKRP